MAKTRSRLNGKPTAREARKINSRHRGEDFTRDERLSDHDGKLSTQKGRLDAHDGDFSSIRKGETFNQNAIGGGPLAAFSHTENAQGQPKDPEGDTNFQQNSNRAVSGDHVRAKTLKSYHFPDGEIPQVKLQSLSAGKVTSGVFSKERIPTLSGLRGKIGRANISYPSDNDPGKNRPITSELIADSSVGPRILDLDYLDGRYARR